ncbi:MAG: hypothetical protein NTX49_01675 [Chlamydiae bacterium]|nr:hypothetical protein [Chlamydiota bacterium]
MDVRKEVVYSKRAEMVVLGYAVADADGVKAICTVLQKEDFYFTQHQQLFLVIREIHKKGFALDVFLLTAELRLRNTLNQVGGSSYIHQCMEMFQNSGHIEGYIEEIKRFSILRKIKPIEPSLKPSLLTCRAFLRNRDWPTSSSLRYYIFFNRYGFADKCVKRIGRKVLIDPFAFDSWMQEQAR